MIQRDSPRALRCNRKFDGAPDAKLYKLDEEKKLAAAIAQADSGIGMGTGTELAREAGDAILLHSDLAAMVAALKLARSMPRSCIRPICSTRRPCSCA